MSVLKYVQQALRTVRSNGIFALKIRTLCKGPTSKGLAFNCPLHEITRSYGIFSPKVRTSCKGPTSNGLVLGFYSHPDDAEGDDIKLTEAAARFDHFIGGKLIETLKMSKPLPRRGQVRVLYGLEKNFTAVAIVGMGEDCLSYNPVEQIEEQKENVRMVAAVGCRALQELEVQKLNVESFGHAESAAEGSAMSVWLFQELKGPERQLKIPRIELHDSCDFTGWQIGLQKAAAQNLARQLMETPANLLTPLSFAQSSVEVLCKAGVNVEVRVENWARLRNLQAFLAVAKGSCEPPIFLEACYEGCDPHVNPIVIVGKGVTFNSGGLCLKGCGDMKHMRGDIAGAACVVAAMRAISALQLPINVRALIPLCENMPGANAFKPGDVVTAMNGKTILVEETDSEGQLILADALCYAKTYKPKMLIDVGTLTTDMQAALGSSATGVFSNSNQLYEMLRIASIHTGDRIWRFPLWEHFYSYMHDEKSDLVNVGKGNGAGCCKAAAFLNEFIPCHTSWIHLDTYGVSRTSGRYYTYLRRGMSGRPTRTLIEFMAQLACKAE